jgi:ZIP family zinc transporter
LEFRIFLEGIAVNAVAKNGNEQMKSFMYGQSSALVEPIAAVLGLLQLPFSTNFTYAFILRQVP